MYTVLPPKYCGSARMTMPSATARTFAPSGLRISVPLCGARGLPLNTRRPPKGLVTPPGTGFSSGRVHVFSVRTASAARLRFASRAICSCTFRGGSTYLGATFRMLSGHGTAAAATEMFRVSPLTFRERTSFPFASMGMARSISAVQRPPGPSGTAVTRKLSPRHAKEASKGAVSVTDTGKACPWLTFAGTEISAARAAPASVRMHSIMRKRRFMKSPVVFYLLKVFGKES